MRTRLPSFPQFSNLPLANYEAMSRVMSEGRVMFVGRIMSEGSVVQEES